MSKNELLIKFTTYLNENQEIKIKDVFIPRRSGLKQSIFLCILVYAIILGGYFLLKDVFEIVNPHSITPLYADTV